MADRDAKEKRLAHLSALIADDDGQQGEITAEEIADQHQRDRDEAALHRRSSSAVQCSASMIILDAGAFVALERNERTMWVRLKAALLAGEPPITHGGVVGQVWRGGSGKQARLAQALQAVDVNPLTDELGRRAGVLPAETGTSDVDDAALVSLADHNDQIVTGDPGDIATLVAVTNRRVDVVTS